MGDAHSAMYHPDSTTRSQFARLPFLGVGLGYRAEFKDELLENAAQVDFLECMLEHFIDMPPERQQDARLLADRFDIVIHGLELSIGTIEPLRVDYLSKMRDLVSSMRAHWASDHLCMTSVPGRAIGNLTPLPLSRDIVSVVARKCRAAVEFLPVPFLLENISVLFRPGPTDMSEPDAILQVLDQSGAGLLLDLTNVFNNATNERFDARLYLDRMPLDRVVQIHLAGGMPANGVLLDTHNAPVPDEVFDLLRYAAPHMLALRSVMIERDQDFPPFKELVEELDRVKDILRRHWAPRFASGLTRAPSWLGAAARVA